MILFYIRCCTCARCKNEVCLFRAETKRRAMGSFFAARHSGRFSKEEASQCSQCLAKFRMSANRLMKQHSHKLEIFWNHIIIVINNYFLERVDLSKLCQLHCCVSRAKKVSKIIEKCSSNYNIKASETERLAFMGN